MLLCSILHSLTCVDNRFATLAPNGLLLYNGRFNDQHDFVAIEIRERKLEVSFSLGDDVTYASVEKPVTDGQWHIVRVQFLNNVSTNSIPPCLLLR